MKGKFVPKEYRWECPLCGSKGKRLLGMFKAERYDRMHMWRIHGEKERKTILIKELKR